MTTRRTQDVSTRGASLVGKHVTLLRLFGSTTRGLLAPM
jgi:hypothetical protein